MGERFRRTSAQPDSLLWSRKCDVKPERQAVARPTLQQVELQWYIYRMQIRLVSFQKVNDVPNRFTHANSDVECVNDRLPEVFFDRTALDCR